MCGGDKRRKGKEGWDVRLRRSSRFAEEGKAGRRPMWRRGTVVKSGGGGDAQSDDAEESCRTFQSSW